MYSSDVLRRKFSGDVSSSDEETFNNKGTTSDSYVPLIDKIQRRIANKDYFFSCEFFPPRTPAGAVNLVTKFDKFAEGKPLFCDVTWHAAGNPISDSPTSSILIANTMLNYCGLETMLHMTCVNLTAQDIDKALSKADNYSIRNIMALRGDLPKGTTEWKHNPEGFNYGVDLVRYIRRKYKRKFVISVAGYPNTHPEAESYAADLQFLKAKVDAGADFIVTQLFFDVKQFLKFQRNCREIGINCPIIPGVMPIQAYQSLRNIVALSKLEVPSEILQVVERLRDNEQAIRAYGVDLAVKQCKELLNSGEVFGIHFYTLNRELATIDILKQIGLWNSCETSLSVRELPWKRSTANCERCSEGIRPIFWSNRPNSYVYRTKHWDEFPQSRWGEASVAAFKELEDPYLFYLRVRASKEELLDMWHHELYNEQDVWQVFYNHITGKINRHGVQVASLPWNPNAKLSPETKVIQTQLAQLNERGILTINSQPTVNGAPSSHETFGWGPSAGYVYQKAYLEFFIPCQYYNQLIDILSLPQYTNRVNYHIVQSDLRKNNSSPAIGESKPNGPTTSSDKVFSGDVTNCDDVRPIAVTWGVFSGCEILQPTVVDPLAFKYWKREAFDLWIKHWAILYDESSHSRVVLEQIHDNYLLVNLVDNDFQQDNCLFDLMQLIQS